MRNPLWQDRKRIFGMPITFTKYKLFEDKLVHSKGLLSMREGEILLYRIMDVELNLTLFNRLFGVGTIILYTGDVTDKEFRITNVSRPREVIELINQNVENQRIKLGVKGKELYGLVNN